MMINFYEECPMDVLHLIWEYTSLLNRHDIECKLYTENNFVTPIEQVFWDIKMRGKFSDNMFICYKKTR